MIAGVTYAIRLVDDPASTGAELNATVEEEDHLDGLFLSEHRTILIRKTQGERDRASTLFHELIHAAAPELPEASVAALEKNLFPILWSLGFKTTRAKRPPRPRDSD